VTLFRKISFYFIFQSSSQILLGQTTDEHEGANGSNQLVWLFFHCLCTIIFSCFSPFVHSHYHSHIQAFLHMHSFILPLLVFKPSRLQLSCSALAFSLAGSRLQHWLELSRHADVFLLLTDDALDAGRQPAGVPGKHDAVAVVAAAIFLQGAAGVGDGVIVVVGVDHPVVVTWLERKEEVSQ